MLGLFSDGEKVEAFRYESGSNRFERDLEFFDGTGGPILKQMLAEEAIRDITRHYTGGRTNSRAAPGIMHEIVEMAFVQRNSGHFFLDEFGGGFQVIEHFEGKFHYVASVGIIGVQSDLKDRGHDFAFEPEFVLQRYVDNSFTIAVCPLSVDQNVSLNSLRLDIEKTMINMAESLLDAAKEINKEQFWTDVDVDYFALVALYRTNAGKQYLNYWLSTTLRRVDGCDGSGRVNKARTWRSR